MQVYLKQRDAKDLARWHETLRFYPHRDEISFCDAPEDGTVFLRLDEALYLRPAIASFHLAADFALLWIKSSDASLVERFTGGRTIYTFWDDEVAQAACKQLPHRALKQVGGFWRDQDENKILVLSTRQSCDILISQNPDGFIHLVLNEAAQHFSFAAELYDFDYFRLFKNLELIRKIQQSDGEQRNSWRSALIENSASYSFFARHYDSYMAHVDYDLWVKRLVAWQDQYAAAKGKKALELACGTANLASRLILEGYGVDAADISPLMLLFAAQKEIKPNLYQAALTDAIPGRDYDLVFCLFDSINYLLSHREISECFAQVHLALKPGGIFIFDISTLQNSLENFAELCTYEYSQNHHLVHEAFYEPQRQRQFSRLSYFEKRGAGYTMNRELHQQRVYHCTELVGLISESPLKLLAIRSTNGKSNLLHKRVSSLDRQYHRLFFILGKNA